MGNVQDDDTRGASLVPLEPFKGVQARAQKWLVGNWWLALSMVLVLLGIWLRSQNIFFNVISLWTDEAHGANELMRGRMFEPSVRPVGFMAATFWLASLFGPTETALRFIPWLSGVLGALVAIPLARRLLHAPGIRVLFVAILALHPFAIDFSREFKPYSTSLLIHLSCLWCALSYWQTRAMRWLLAAVTLAWFGVLFAQDVVFLYPGLYLAAAITAWRAGKQKQKQLIVVFAAGLITVALLGVLYWFLWRHMSGPANAGKGKAFGYERAFFSASWDMFWSPKTGMSIPDWLAGKFMDIAAFPGIRREDFTELGPLSTVRVDVLRRLDYVLWILLAGIGLLRMGYQRRVREFLLIVLPVLVTAALNLKLLWPFGAIRTNLFMLVYASSLICIGLDTRRVAQARHWSRILPVLVLVLVPILVLDRSPPRIKSELLDAARALLELQGAARPPKREILILDGGARDPWRYYNDTHPRHRKLFAELATRFDARASRGFNTAPMTLARRVVPRRADRFWLLLAHPRHVAAFFEQGAPPGYERLAAKRTEGGAAMVVALRRAR